MKWRFVGNLPVAQFYHINIDNEIPYNVYGGMQDNGSWRGPAYVWRTKVLETRIGKKLVLEMALMLYLILKIQDMDGQ